MIGMDGERESGDPVLSAPHDYDDDDDDDDGGGGGGGGGESEVVQLFLGLRVEANI